MHELNKYKAVPVAITVDNESSPNAGIARAIERRFPHIIHLRCGCHTVELLMNAFSKCFSGISATADTVKSLVILINNSKELLGEFRTIQMGNGREKPLVLVMHCNTRKWSSSFLMLERYLSFLLDTYLLNIYISL